MARKIFKNIEIIKKLIIWRYIVVVRKEGIGLTEKKSDFKVDYSKLKIFEEYNTSEMKFPVVLSAPHSGRIFPEEFLNAVQTDINELRSNEDSFVDELVMPASDAGIPLLAMNISRAFVDVNRDKIEIDPNMFFNHPQKDMPMGRRCRVGLGVIHRITANNNNIYDGLLNFDEAQERFKYVYDAYHKKLQQLVDKCVKKFGFCLLIDCHSMPSKICSIMNDGKNIEFCLGNLFDQSCPAEFGDFLKNELEKRGYHTTFNCPYSGAFITFNFCQPRKKIYTLQLETNRSLYMEEDVYKKKSSFQALSSDISASVKALAQFLLDFKN